jgi:hypothetical protein
VLHRHTAGQGPGGQALKQAAQTCMCKGMQQLPCTFAAVILATLLHAVPCSILDALEIDVQQCIYSISASSCSVCPCNIVLTVS